MDTIIDRFEAREEALRNWCRENVPDIDQDQRHLDADTEARAYWNYGYLVAIQDVLRELGGSKVYN